MASLDSNPLSKGGRFYLLIPNGEFPLRLLVVLRELLEVLHYLGLQHRG